LVGRAVGQALRRSAASSPRTQIREGGNAVRRRVSLFFVLYIAIGVVVAFARDQLTEPFLRDLLEVVLLILLWPLTALGLVNFDL
jgi:hypothetical protein